MAEFLHIVCPDCATTNRVPRERLDGGGKCGKCGKPLFARRPAALDAASFEKQVNQSDIPVLIDVWAAWCGPCRVMGPIFERAAQELEPQVRLAKLDSEAEPQVASRLGIQSIPTLILMHKGRELARQSGVMDQARLVGWVHSHL
jgi:thioredoxin 2